MLTKAHLVKTIVFPGVMYGCDIWIMKKANCWIIDAFELWCWRRLLRVPWTERRSSQSVLKEISPECSLEGLMLKLKLQHFGHLMQRADSFEKTLMLGKIEGGKRRGRQRMRWWIAPPTRSRWVWAGSRDWWWIRKPGILLSMWLWIAGHDWVPELNCYKENPWFCFHILPIWSVFNFPQFHPSSGHLCEKTIKPSLSQSL